MDRSVYTPSELNRKVRLHLEDAFPRLWVEGEISNLARPASGHVYFTLKDERAQLRCALFRSHARTLDFRPANGQLIQVRGRLGLYEPRGEYQLIADRAEMAGEGRLRAAFEALKKRLEAEGLFAESAKQRLPSHPRRIGVVTSPSGAVIRDILQVLRRRWPLARVRLYPVPVQGEAAVPALVRALDVANRQGWAQALIVGRGGGSLEDLWAFNEEAVARAVFASRIPVLSAVGHETDFSITDFVADLRAPTPSAAAELLTPDRDALLRTFDAALGRLRRAGQEALARRSQRLDELAGRLSRQHPGRRLLLARERLGELGRRLENTIKRQLGERRRILEPMAKRLAYSGTRMSAARRTDLQSLRLRLDAAAGRLVPERRQALGSLARTLHALSPLPTLERGYAILLREDTGESVQSVAGIDPGDRLTAQLADGRLHASVDRVSGRRLGEESGSTA